MLIKFGGLGRHVAAIYISDSSMLVTNGKLEFALLCMYGTAIIFPRLVILNLYLRIFVEKWYRIACKVLIFLLTIHFCAQLVTTTLQCVLLSRLWNLSDSDGHCVDIIAYYRWSSITCTIEDVLMLLLPIPVILKLQLPRRDKIGLFLTFSTASM